MKKLVLAVVVIGVLIVFGGRWWKNQQELAYTHRFIESTYKVNEHQQKEIPKVDPADLIAVYRYKDAEDRWQVSLGDPSPADAKGDVRILGSLNRRPQSPEIELPIFLCELRQQERVSRLLDDSSTCAAGGKRVAEAPAGFTSKLIRTGYRLVFQCIDPQHGVYLTLNSRCEGPDHRIVASVGTLRASNH